MRLYQDHTGRSGIKAYAIGFGYIDVEFYSGGIYRYSEYYIGTELFEIMTTLATLGTGLNTFINKFVRNLSTSVR